ncbi:MAG: allantoinase AllB [Spirochaetaceae bacterium]|nr:MAG: allantoinase AllB [Spirochaetaceae bacterium]
MSADFVLRGGQIVLPQGVVQAELVVHEGRIVEVITEPDAGAGTAGAAGTDAAAGTASAGSATRVLDARGFTVFPGVIDAHVHFNEPGRTNWEGIATGSAALAAGGGTCFIDMPLNSDPPLLDGPAFDAKHAAASVRSRTDFAFYGGLTPDNLDSLEELAERGVVGFKAFMCPSGIHEFQHVDADTLHRGMETAARLGLPVLLHAESPAVLAAAAAAADSTAAGDTRAVTAPDAVRRFIDSRPVDAEIAAITQALSVAAETGCRVHIVHVSSGRGVKLIRGAVMEHGLSASCETCPHYLYFNEQDLQDIGARAKCAPPLRDELTRRDLLSRLIGGEIDTVGSDHSPCPPDLKDGLPFEQAWGGIAGVQTTLRTLLTLGVPVQRIAQLTAARPAELFRLPGKGSLQVGNDADFTLVELDHESPVSLAELQDRHHMSPFVNRPLRGRIHATYLRGRRISAETRGQLIRPS